MIPWIALAPDISGVCRVEETLEITSMPTKTLSTKIVSQTMASLTRGLLLVAARVGLSSGVGPPGRPRGCGLWAGHRSPPGWAREDPAVVGHALPVTISSSKSGANAQRPPRGWSSA